MIDFRLAAAGDCEGLARLNYEFNGVDVGAGKIALSLEKNGRESVAVAIKNDKIVGFLCGQLIESFCYGAPYAELTELYVVPKERNKGIATELIGFLEAHYASRGVRSFALQTSASNKNAQGLYEKLGYKKVTEILYRKRNE